MSETAQIFNGSKYCKTVYYQIEVNGNDQDNKLHNLGSYHIWKGLILDGISHILAKWCYTMLLFPLKAIVLIACILHTYTIHNTLSIDIMILVLRWEKKFSCTFHHAILSSFPLSRVCFPPRSLFPPPPPWPFCGAQSRSRSHCAYTRMYRYKIIIIKTHQKY